jgi:hypothetical protein
MTRRHVPMDHDDIRLILPDYVAQFFIVLPERLVLQRHFVIM